MKKEIELIDVESVRAYLKNKENTENTHHTGARIFLFLVLLLVFWLCDVHLANHPFIGQLLMAYLFSRVVV